MRVVITTFVLCFVVLSGCADQGGDRGEAAAAADLDGGRLSRVADGVFSVFPGNYTTDDVSSRTLVAGAHEVLPVDSVVLTSELDGADIDMSMWLPDTGERVPVIIQASPYFARTDAPSGSQRFGAWMVEEFVPHGYAYVQLAIRSTGDSGGCDDFRGPKMTADMSQAIDWLAAQDWSNGNVSLIGKSYPGSTPWYAGGSGNPHIKTIVPVSGSTNAWEVYNRNGTPESRAAIIVPNYGVSAATNGERSNEHKVENFACAEVWEGWAYGVSSGATGERVTDAWWDERNSKPSVEANYEGSILLVHGLEDWNVDPAVAIPWTQQLADSGLEVKQLLGQWQHDWPDQGSDETKRWDWAEILLRWFDRELKGKDVDVGPPVQVQSNDLRWRDELAWPPKDARAWTLHLDADGALANETPAAEGNDLLVPGSTAAEPDPIALPTGEEGKTVHEYRFGPLDDDVRIAGLPKVHVWVVPEAPTGYFGAFLYDESPEGERTRIGWTGMNLRYYQGGEEPQTIVPGQAILAKAQLQPMDALVPAGHALVLEISTDTPSDRIQPPGMAPMWINRGGQHDSVLALPVIDRGEDAFFEPPR